MLGDRFEDALVFTARLHRSQRRKGRDVPYLAHLLAVASLVIEHGGDEDEAIAALLHDAVEDQGGLETRDRIAARFGATVAEIVMGCSDSTIEPKPPWRARKEAYLAHVAAGAPDSVLLVSAADKLHNARAILTDYRAQGEALWQRFTGKRAGTLWYYRALADVFAARGPEALAQELEAVVGEIEALTVNSTTV